MKSMGSSSAASWGKVLPTSLGTGLAVRLAAGEYGQRTDQLVDCARSSIYGIIRSEFEPTLRFEFMRGPFHSNLHVALSASPEVAPMDRMQCC